MLQYNHTCHRQNDFLPHDDLKKMTSTVITCRFYELVLQFDESAHFLVQLPPPVHNHCVPEYMEYNRGPLMVY